MLLPSFRYHLLLDQRLASALLLLPTASRCRGWKVQGLLGNRSWTPLPSSPALPPFSTRQRGGKKQKKADARAEQTAAGEREPKEFWSEAKREAYNRLQSLAERRRELSVLEAKAREDFQSAGGEVEAPLASAPRGSGDQDCVEVEIPEESGGSGIYSDLAAASEGFYSSEAQGARGPSSAVDRGRSRSRTPKPSARPRKEQAPTEEGPETIEEKPEPAGARYIVPKSARRKKESAKKAQAEAEDEPEASGSPSKKAEKAEQPEAAATIETPRGFALAPRPKSRPKTEKPSPKTDKPSPIRVPVLSAAVEEQELRPVQGSITAPAKGKTKVKGQGPSGKTGEDLGIEAKGEAPGKKAKGEAPGKAKITPREPSTPPPQGSQVPPEPASPLTARHTSTRVVLDFHEVLDLDEAATNRSGRRCW